MYLFMGIAAFLIWLAYGFLLAHFDSDENIAEIQKRPDDHGDSGVALQNPVTSLDAQFEGVTAVQESMCEQANCRDDGNAQKPWVSVADKKIEVHKRLFPKGFFRGLICDPFLTLEVGFILGIFCLNSFYMHLFKTYPV